MNIHHQIEAEQTPHQATIELEARLCDLKRLAGLLSAILASNDDMDCRVTRRGVDAIASVMRRETESATMIASDLADLTARNKGAQT